jgi:hypothetical protein
MKKQDSFTGFRKSPAHTRLAQNGILLTLLFAFAFFSPALAQDSMPPQIEIPEKEFRSEPVEQGQDIVHTFRILNRGEGPLQIVKVKPG